MPSVALAAASLVLVLQLERGDGNHFAHTDRPSLESIKQYKTSFLEQIVGALVESLVDVNLMIQI